MASSTRLRRLFDSDSDVDSDGGCDRTGAGAGVASGLPEEPPEEVVEVGGTGEPSGRAGVPSGGATTACAGWSSLMGQSAGAAGLEASP